MVRRATIFQKIYMKYRWLADLLPPPFFGGFVLVETGYHFLKNLQEMWSRESLADTYSWKGLGCYFTKNLQEI